MNLENIKIGMEIKNYKALCEMLGEKVKRGNAQNSQIKEWNRFFSFEKDGHKIIIKEVFDEPMHKNDGRNNGNNSIYIKYIETILLYILSSYENQTLVCTKNYLMVALGITGQKYISRRYKKSLVASEKYTQDDLNEFDNRTYSFLDRLLIRSLDNLKRRCLLDWNEELHITIYDDYIENSIERPATDDERRIYVETKRDVMHDLGVELNDEDKFDSLRDIYLSNLNDRFYKELNHRLLENYEWEKTCIKYRIIFTKSHVTKAINKTEKQLDSIVSNEKNELNSTVIQALNTSIETHYHNNVLKFEDAVRNCCWINIPQYKLDEDYVLKQKSLTNDLVKR